MQGHVQPVGVTGLGQQRGGCCWIARWYRGVGQEVLPKSGPNRRILADGAEAQLHALPDGIAIGRQFEGFADAGIGARFTVVAEPRQMMAAGRDIGGVEVGISPLKPRKLELSSRVMPSTVAALDGRDAGLLVIEVDELKACLCLARRASNSRWR